MSTLTQFLGGKPRRQIVTLTASNASLPIPVWAQGGKGIVYVTGCGGGASGSILATSGQSGAGGGAGAFAIDHPLLIPAGVTTLNCQIGVGGSAVTAAAATAGVNGGSASVTAGSTSLVLEGGLGPIGAGAARAAIPLPNAMDLTGITLNAPVPFGTASPTGFNGGLTSGASSLGAGAQGGAGNSGGSGWGAGAWSPWGAGGTGRAAGPSVNTNGANASGFGAGGSGAAWISGGTVTSGAGAPGLLILEFVEGV